MGFQSLSRRPEVEEGPEMGGVALEVGREAGEDIDGLGAEMMFDALDVVALGRLVQSEQGEETGEGLVAFFDAGGDGASLFCQYQDAVFFVVEVAQGAQFLDHAGDGGPAYAEGGGEIDGAGAAFGLDQILNAFEVIFGALTGR
jgi:hypothetical protein